MPFSTNRRLIARVCLKRCRLFGPDIRISTPQSLLLQIVSDSADIHYGWRSLPPRHTCLMTQHLGLMGGQPRGRHI